MAEYQPQPDEGQAPASASRAAQWAGAVISLALVLGGIYWAYSIIVRDVSGIPVISASDKPLRVQPEDPGGRPADNQGLAVNDVVGVGSATTPAEMLILAPEPVDLVEDDQPLGQLPILAPVDETTDLTDAEDAQQALDLAESLIAEQAEEGEVAGGQEAILLAVLEATATPDAATGPTRVPVPQLRPNSVQPVVSAAPSAPVTKEVDPDAVPDGARLVQLGAFDSEAVARSEWDRLAGIFPGYLDDKSRVIQRAASGGRVFYRLRALGFEDIEDARRFCAAFKARNQDCVPVLVR